MISSCLKNDDGLFHLFSNLLYLAFNAIELANICEEEVYLETNFSQTIAINLYNKRGLGSGYEPG